MECPYCGEPLTYHDYYGHLRVPEHYWERSCIDRVGDIFRCQNEDCSMWQQLFYTDEKGELHEGYPC